MNKQKLILIILDGWGIAKYPALSAIDAAHTPYIDDLYRKYTHSTLSASGKVVGLPANQMGNSEVGHLTIGAGRVVYQDLVKINTAIKDQTFYSNKALINALTIAKSSKKSLHFIGLVSNGGVHAHIDHLKALCTAAKLYGLQNVFIHALTDGRDTSPHTAINFLQNLTKHLHATTGKIASITGRYYAMDRDKRWQRTQKAYDAFVYGVGKHTQNWEAAIMSSYKEGLSDEFINPIIITNQDHIPLATIQPGDIVLNFNFRNDRVKQITQALTQSTPLNTTMYPLDIQYFTLTQYDQSFKNIQVLFDKTPITNTLGEVLSIYNKKQVRIAETEKYPHITYFLSGGYEKKFVGEARILCPSPKNVTTYAEQPTMNALAITQETCIQLTIQNNDFICVNFANPDMVGHTGNWSATIQACEVVDRCLAKIIPVACQHNYTVFIIADHGNADQMLHLDGTPHTAHTTNKVPAILINNTDTGYRKLRDGTLADVAPTILQLLNIPLPYAMQGHSLLF